MHTEAFNTEGGSIPPGICALLQNQSEQKSCYNGPYDIQQ